MGPEHSGFREGADAPGNPKTGEAMKSFLPYGEEETEKGRNCVTRELLEEDLDNLRHMLGVRKDKPRARWGYRNHFCAGVGDIPSMERLYAHGLVFRKGAYPSISAHGVFYAATVEGMRAAGLDEAKIEEMTPTPDKILRGGI